MPPYFILFNEAGPYFRQPTNMYLDFKIIVLKTLRFVKPFLNIERGNELSFPFPCRHAGLLIIRSLPLPAGKYAGN
jgi:hypothetical protein